jgi:ABC-2 type transport system permease protein
MKRYLKIYRVFFAQYLKQLIQYRVDFSIGILSFLLIQFSGILFIGLVFQSIHTLNGWTLDQMVFLYGFFQIPRGLDHLFTDNIWLIPNKIRRGGCRPLSGPSDQSLVSMRFRTFSTGSLR